MSPGSQGGIILLQDVDPCAGEKVTKCPICHANNADNAGYCVSCGNRISRQSTPPPRNILAAVVVGVILGLFAGPLMAITSLSWPGPPYIVPLVLIYGLGVAVLIVCVFGEHLFPVEMRTYLTPFSTSFAGTYYIACFGYLLVYVT